jgi:hypothetical protein
MSPESAEGRYKGIFDFILLKTEHQIGRRPIKGDFMIFYQLSLRNEQKKLPNFQEKFDN